MRVGLDARRVLDKVLLVGDAELILLVPGVFERNDALGSAEQSGVDAGPKRATGLILVITFAIAAAVRDIIRSTLGGLSYGRTLANLASAFIIGLGVIAALNQMGIAVTVTVPILIAVLATIGGILIVGVGGGLIRPMQQRWESYLTKAEEEAPRIKAEAQGTPLPSRPTTTLPGQTAATRADARVVRDGGGASTP